MNNTALLALGIVVVAAEVAALVMAVRRLRRPGGPVSRTLEIVAAALPLLVFAAVAASIQSARASIRHALVAARPNEKAASFAHGISGEQHALVYGVLLIAAAISLACVAAGLAVRGRWRRAGKEGPRSGLVVASALAFVLLGMGPVLASVLGATALRVRGMATLAQLPAEQKLPAIEMLLAQIRTLLDRGFMASAIAIVVVAVVTGVVTWRLSRRHGPAVIHPALPPTLGLVALVLMAAASPMARENETPWPSLGGPLGPALDATTPALEGPDRVDSGPLLELTGTRIRLGRREMEPSQIGDALQVMRANHHLLHRGSQFRGNVLVACEPQVATALVGQALAAAAAAGSDHRRAIFVFSRRLDHKRPMLGSVRRNDTSGAVATVIDRPEDAPPGATVIRTSEHATCGALAEAIVKARRAGQTVALLTAP